MDTIDRILALISTVEMTNKDLEKAIGLGNGSITNWKNRRYSPGADAILNIAKYFRVTTDYLFCLSDTPVAPSPFEKSISEEESLLLEAYRAADTQGRFRIIQVCMNENDAAAKRAVANAG